MLLNRRTLKTFVTLAKSVLNLKPRDSGPGDSGPVVVFSELGDSFLITAQHENCWLQYREIGEFDFTLCSLPWSGLQEVAKVGADDLTLTMEREQNCVTWTENGTPVERCYPDGPSDETPAFFPAVEGWTPQSARLLTALNEASQTTAKESTRYALNCLLLRGKTRDMVATDSRQLLIQKGWEWPWSDDPVEVGRSEKHVVFRLGPWTLGFPIDTKTRFPSVDSIIPDSSVTLATLVLDEADHNWLAEKIPRTSRNSKQIATIELNGAVAVRCAEQDQSPDQEWILSQSRREGAETTFESDVCYLSRLHDLGLSRVEIPTGNSPFVARDSQQTYLWMGLSGEPSPRPENITRVASPRMRGAGSLSQPSPRKRNVMTKPKTTPSSSSEPAAEIDTVEQVIERATMVKTRLKDLQSEVQDLITALRGQKKQAKIVRNTIDSLQRLNTLQA